MKVERRAEKCVLERDANMRTSIVVDEAVLDRAYAYPYLGPYESYVFTSYQGEHRRETHPATVSDAVDVLMGSGEYTPILACGSNAGFEQLVRKFGTSEDSHGDAVDIPVLIADVTNWSSVYAACISPYGSVFATFGYTPGITSKLYLTLLPNSLLDTMHISEGVDTSKTRDYDWCIFHKLNAVVNAEFVGTLFSNQCYGYITKPLITESGDMIHLSAFENNGVFSLNQVEIQRYVHRSEIRLGLSMDQCVTRCIKNKKFRVKKVASMRSRPLRNMIMESMLEE